MPAESFDVFLSHNSSDKPAVEQLAERLRDDDIKVWFDKWNLVPGTPFQEAIEKALPTCRCCVFFVGPDGTGPWHELEMRVALNLQIAAGRDFRVIPVLLPGARPPDHENLPRFLHELTWVQFGAEDDADAYHQLVCGIRGEAPGFAPAKVDEPAVDDHTLKIVPRGLRSFDAEDGRFFLRLLPGPRDHRGLPVGVAFWKDRLDQIDPERTFRVGLMYGPSGCGKTSLVKAGLLPRLAEYVKPIYLEATPADTERQLLARLRRRFSGLPDDLDLADSFRYAIDQPEVLEGYKVVVILDQFEQWLHANGPDADCPLVAALRQCDGTHVQCVLMVRADFFLGIHRLMAVAESPIRQDVNMALVDLFDPPHGRRVLAEFGRAYDEGFPDDLDELREPQAAFLDQAVSELADHDQKLGAVHLALFADMIRSKPWTPGTLKTVGGAAGVGRTFLEENFDRPTANPAQRVHRKAAMAVLSKLLPEPGADMRGAMQPRDELLQAAGYEQQPGDFDELMHILVNELRIVSPAVAESDEERLDEPTTNEDCYQLTHDYLVSSLRDWLTARQKETAQGRAHLKLAERAAQWNRAQQSRYLPSAWEYLNIRRLTNPRTWSDDERRMMKITGRRYVTRFAAAFAIVLLVGLLVWWFVSDQRRRSAEAIAENLVKAQPAAVPYLIDDLGRYAARKNVLWDHLKSERSADNDRIHVLCALHAFGEDRTEELVARIRTAVDGECPNIVSALRQSRDRAIEFLDSEIEKAATGQDWPHMARLAIVTLHLGEAQTARKMLSLGADTTQRTVFISVFSTWHGDVSELAPIMAKTEDPAFRSGSCLALGSIGPETLSEDVLQVVTAIIAEWHVAESDTGLHSSTRWALNRLSADIPPVDRSCENWSENSIGLTMLHVVPQEQDRRSGERSFDDLGPYAPPEPRAIGEDPDDVLGESFPVDIERAAPFIEPTAEYIESLAMRHAPPRYDYFLSDREISVRQFRKFIDDVKSSQSDSSLEWKGADANYSPTDDHPVQNVTWLHAVSFCNWLSRKENLTPCYVRTGKRMTTVASLDYPYEVWQCSMTADGYRLPTEAEWRYACRAGSHTRYHCGEDVSHLKSYAVYRADHTQPCGHTLPNGWGFFDMHGNVWEWCQSVSAGRTASSEFASNRIMCGGSFMAFAADVGSNTRMHRAPHMAAPYCGFRIARTADAGSQEPDRDDEDQAPDRWKTDPFTRYRQALAEFESEQDTLVPSDPWSAVQAVLREILTEPNVAKMEPLEPERKFCGAVLDAWHFDESATDAVSAKKEVAAMVERLGSKGTRREVLDRSRWLEIDATLRQVLARRLAVDAMAAAYEAGTVTSADVSAEQQFLCDAEWSFSRLALSVLPVDKENRAAASAINRLLTYVELAQARSVRDASLEFWAKVRTKQMVGVPGGEAVYEARARALYYENAARVHAVERRLKTLRNFHEKSE